MLIKLRIVPAIFCVVQHFRPRAGRISKQFLPRGAVTLLALSKFHLDPVRYTSTSCPVSRLVVVGGLSAPKIEAAVSVSFIHLCKCSLHYLDSLKPLPSKPISLHDSPHSIRIIRKLFMWLCCSVAAKQGARYNWH
jgi:hypothetical protein